MNYIILTDSAIESLKNKLEKRNTPNSYIRVGLSAGCAGFKYNIQFEDNNPKPTDLKLFFNGIRVAIDHKSIVYLNESIIDWDKSLMSEGFKIFNKREKSRCGCGQSFQPMEK